ncbi:hypothetical protein AB4Y85_15565 [Microvirga sp. 2YAF29]|uniref:hypothetical protein n=1 Tax=Microvirga sp. 2YAF29 TaxID=3233031 RepID=UPI003F96B12D
MSQAKTSIKAVSEQISSPRIQGRLDAIEDRRLYGWVWDSGLPTERLLVRILLEGRMVASATADLPRVDLRRNGIGDGGYAFEVELAEALANVSDSLTVVAVSPSTGEEIILQSPNQSERAAEAAITVPLNRVLDRMDMLIEAQRRSQLMQREASETLRSTAKQVEEITSQESEINAALETVTSTQAELSRRVADIEVFHLRFDQVLADFGKRIDELSKAADRPFRRAVALLVALGGLSAASAVVTLLVVMRYLLAR